MDLLDNITSMMTTTGNERFGKPKPKAELKKEPAAGPAATAAPTSFRIPKKKPGGVQPNSHDAASQSPLSRTSSNSSYRLDSGDGSRNSPVMEVDDKTGVREVIKMEPREFGRGRPMKQEHKPSFGAGTSGEFVIPRKMDIEMNGLQLDLSVAPEFVNRYHINITKIMRNKEKDATKGPREDLPTQHRRRALFSLFKQLVKSNPEVFGEDRHKHVYDLGNTFYSVGCSITKEHGEWVYKIPAEQISSEFSRNFLSKGGLKELVFTIQWTGQVYIKGPKQNEDDGTRREAARFFDVLTSQTLFHGDHYIFGNKFFEKQCDGDVRLGEGKCVKRGFEKNVRFLGDTEESAAPVLQIDTKKSPFYNEQTVLQFIGEIFTKDMGSSVEEALSVKSVRRKVAKELRDLVVTTTHMTNNRNFYVHGLVDNNARNQFFETDKGEISVEQYFFHQYNLELKHPLLPLVSERKGTSGFSFYPLEVLKIERGQRVDNRKLTGKISDSMINEARMLPHIMREHNRRQLETGRLTSEDNPYLCAFGVQAANSFVTSEAKVLSAPEIKYKTDSLQPDRSGTLSWRLNRIQFFRPSTVKSVSLVVFDRAVTDQQALDFFGALARAGRVRGMIVQDNCAKVEQLPSEAEEIIEEHFRSCVGKVSMILCITKVKKDVIHDTLKMLEAKYAVLTQHVCVKTALDCIERAGAAKLENVLLKFNVKNGGLNHTLSAPRLTLSNGTTQKDMDGRLFQGKMFVGFELSHAGAQSLYDRQNATAVKEPTVVGFSYSMGEPTDYSGFWWYQQPRLHRIQYITNHFARAFLDYHKKNKRLPAEVFVYRSGMSEGEFSEVTEEANEIRVVAERMRDLNSGRPYRPKITVIVAQTNSNYRIMPASQRFTAGQKAQDLNVPSGTCADTVIVHPQFREFILTSQRAIIGTSRPTRYTIVAEDKPHISVEIAEHLTHFLSHGHQQSTLPTHVPAVLYAAENMAKRGRAAWKTSINENCDGASSSSSHRISLRDGESPEDFYCRFSQDLMNSLPNHYFA